MLLVGIAAVMQSLHEVTLAYDSIKVINDFIIIYFVNMPYLNDTIEMIKMFL